MEINVTVLKMKMIIYLQKYMPRQWFRRVR